MKLCYPTTVSGRRILALALLVILAWCTHAGAQDSGSWWGSSAWWDWSDFRAALGVRYFMPRFVSGSIDRSAYAGEGAPGTTVNIDLTGDKYGFKEEMEPFNEVWGILYIDRLGLRFHVEDDQQFEGLRVVTVTPPPANDFDRLSVLDVRGSWLGLDLDIVRYPFLRLGINGDWHTAPVKFLDRSQPGTPEVNDWYLYESKGPITIGIHGRVIPVRIREVPFTIDARARMPIPYLKRQNEAKMVDWEVAAGLRPAVWDLSLYGYSTFSFGLEAGFRSVTFEMTSEGPNFQTASAPKVEMNLKARWQGAFVQAILFY